MTIDLTQPLDLTDVESEAKNLEKQENLNTLGLRPNVILHDLIEKDFTLSHEKVVNALETVVSLKALIKKGDELEVLVAYLVEAIDLRIAHLKGQYHVLAKAKWFPKGKECKKLAMQVDELKRLSSELQKLI